MTRLRQAKGDATVGGGVASSSSSSLAKPPGGNVGNSGRFWWTFMLCGLLTTLVNVFYEAGTTLERLHLLSASDSIDGLVESNEPPQPQEQRNDKQLPSKKSSPSASSAVAITKSNDQIMNWSALDPELVRDKAPLLKLLQDAGISNVDSTTLAKLPSWSEVIALYGDKPILYGYPEECTRFQNQPNASFHFVSTAGTFNTGTNLMAELLIANCHLPEHEKAFNGGPGVRWQVSWGKHTPVHNETYRLIHRVYEDKNVIAQHMFPAVMVRDPYKWMQSMCRHEYAARWKRDKDDEHHCPNLVMENKDGGTGGGAVDEPVKVTVNYADFDKHHDSLVHFWNEWYQDYFNAPFPRLLVRFEDLIYHPRMVVKQVCECAGGKLRPKFTYIVNSAKKGTQAHGNVRTSYLDALSRYGTKQGRYKGFRPVDLDYVKKHLNSSLMHNLGYPFHQDSHLDAGT